jgi:hypothetical protein
MAWTYIPGSGKISLEGVEFEMADGTHTRRCFISQQEIDKWATLEKLIKTLRLNFLANTRRKCVPLRLVL